MTARAALAVLLGTAIIAGCGGGAATTPTVLPSATATATPGSSSTPVEIASAAPSAEAIASAEPAASIVVTPATPKPTPKPTAKPTVKPTARPTPRPTPRPTAKPAAVYYKNCDAVRAAGAAPLYRGEPGYRAGLDRDNDGIACE